MTANLPRKDHISHSQMQNGRCLLLYRENNLLKNVYEESEGLLLGRLVHLIAYAYVKHCVESKMDSDFELMNEIIDSEFKKSRVPEKFYVEVREQMLQFAERGVSFESIFDYEREFLINIRTDDDPIWIKGIMDRINSYMMDNSSVLEIVDYKNQMNIATVADVEKNEQLQLYRYIACNFLFPGFKKVRVGLYHTRYNFMQWGKLKEVDELFGEFESTYKSLERQWERLIKSPDEAYNIPEPGPVCFENGGCPLLLAGKCPAYDKDSMHNPDDIQNKVRLLRKIDMDRKELLNEIKEYYKTAPNEEIDGGEVGFSPSETIKYDLELFLKIAEKNGIPKSMFLLGKMEVEKAIKNYVGFGNLDEEDSQILEDARIVSQSTRFKY